MGKCFTCSGGSVIPADEACNCNVCPDCGGCMENLILKRAEIPDDWETGGSTTTETTVDCPVCGCTPVPIVDADELKQNSKADCIYQKLINGGILSDFISRYFAPSEQSHSFLGELNLTWTLGNTAETLPVGVPQNGAYYSVEIRLNETLLNSGSATNVALTMLHEALHAKCDFQ